MKKLFQVLFALISLMSAGVVAAQNCIPAPQIMGQPPRCYDGRIIPPGGVSDHHHNRVVVIAPQPMPMPQPVYVQQVPQPVYVQQPVYAQQAVQTVPAPSGFSNCSLLGAVLGGAAGNRLDNHGAVGTILGAILGGVTANAVCTNIQGQRVLVQVPTQNSAPALPAQQVLQQQVVPQSVGITCTVRTLVTGGEEIRRTVQVVSGRDCEEIGGLIEKVRTERIEAARVPDSAVREPLPLNGCGVTLNGRLIKELPQRENSSCETDRRKFVEKFRAECLGKTGSDAGDRACGARLTLD